MPKTYRLSAAGLDQMRRRFVLLMSVYLALAFGVALALNLWRRPENPLVYVLATAVIIGGGAFLVVPRSLKQNEAGWQSIRLVVSDDYVERSQAGVPVLRLRRAEVVALEASGAGLLLRTADPYRTLLIPRALDAADFAAIQQQLSQWQPITSTAGRTTLVNTVVTVIALAGLGTLMVSNTLWLVGVAGVVTISLYAYLLWQTRRTVGVDPRFKRTMQTALVVPILLTAMKVCVLAGGYVAFFQWLFALSGTGQ